MFAWWKQIPHSLYTFRDDKQQLSAKKNVNERSKKKQTNWINNKKQIKLINTKNKQCKKYQERFLFSQLLVLFRMNVRIAIAKSEEDNDNDDDVLTPFHIYNQLLLA